MIARVWSKVLCGQHISSNVITQTRRNRPALNRKEKMKTKIEYWCYRQERAREELAKAQRAVTIAEARYSLAYAGQSDSEMDTIYYNWTGMQPKEEAPGK